MESIKAVAAKKMSQMMNNEEFEKRLNDARAYCIEKPVIRTNKPSDKCGMHEVLGENACDGTGLVWWKDQKRAMDLIDGKYERIFVDGVEKPIEWTTECPCRLKRLEEAERAKKLSTVGIPNKFVDARLSNFSVKYHAQEDVEKAIFAKKAATSFVDNYERLKGQSDAKGFYLYSKRKGSGKSRLLATLGNELMIKGVDVMYINATNVAKEVRATFNSDNEINELDVIKTFIDAEVLLIDDLAVDKPSRFVEELYYKIFNERMEKNKITCIASNLTINEFGNQTYYENKSLCSYADERGDSRTGSRLNTMCYELFMPEESMRDREAKYQDEQFEKMLFGED